MQQVELCLNCRNFYRQLTQPNQPDTNFLSRFHLFLFRVVLAFLKMHLHNNRHCYPKHCRQIPIRLCWGIAKPNITGSAEFNKIYTYANGFEGALFFDKTKHGYTTGSEKITSYTTLCIDASRTNNIYRNSTVQPAAIQTLIIIKV